MRQHFERLVLLLTVSFLVLAVAQSEPSALFLAGVATVALASALGARYLAVLITSRTLTVGHRSHAHREALSVAPSPQHPDTAGRPRPRAPAQFVAVA